ncbi:MAG: PhzF family phenazine biosynthesis protein [Burkholderiaceae bacterium]
MKQRPFKQVDVFTQAALRGNPLAVVLDGEGLDEATMRDFAKWTNLSETTFLLPPTQAGADYRVRIFTPGGELPFAGHPTLGSCHAWLQAGGRPRDARCIIQECAAGLVRIQTAGNRPAFAAPALRRTTPGPGQLSQVAAALGLKASQVVAAECLDNGPVWLSLLLASAQAVLQIRPDHNALKNLGAKVGVAGRHPDGDLEVRAFAAASGIPEDPVTGSLNASLAQWLIPEGHLPAHYTARQGTCMDRAGRVYIDQDGDGQVWVGGDSVTCIEGSVLL